ncbi:hypothetical protein XENORESO_003641 [Xenotaenia resolanae]|uniref:Uncharacterized protein n=1 Tax=Xenotaenia resolanae TaxID=208358 RepID=A0ABV0WCH3_9TELE
MSSKSFLQKKVANISPGDLDILRPACHIQTIRCPGLAACFYVEVTSVFSSIGELLHPSADSCRQSFCALVLLDKAAFIGCCFQMTPLHSQSLSSGVYLEFLNNQSDLSGPVEKCSVQPSSGGLGLVLCCVCAVWSGCYTHISDHCTHRYSSTEQIQLVNYANKSLSAVVLLNFNQDLIPV